ncbi:hypothetical protein V1477_001586 [Vespula maculifrons]|uniref:Uncharacterized protein n=1 Tax=Vespula maculifrons TaxID=7453 RepID=A0ABD2CYA8_VESMC
MQCTFTILNAIYTSRKLTFFQFIVLDAGMQDNSRCKNCKYDINQTNKGILPAVQSLEPISNSEKKSYN